MSGGLWTCGQTRGRFVVFGVVACRLLLRGPVLAVIVSVVAVESIVRIIIFIHCCYHNYYFLYSIQIIFMNPAMMTTRIIKTWDNQDWCDVGVRHFRGLRLRTSRESKTQLLNMDKQASKQPYPLPRAPPLPLPLTLLLYLHLSLFADIFCNFGTSLHFTSPSTPSPSAPSPSHTISRPRFPRPFPRGRE